MHRSAAFMGEKVNVVKACWCSADLDLVAQLLKEGRKGDLQLTNMLKHGVLKSIRNHTNHLSAS